MRTLTIILAQGSQSRLPHLTVAKQLLPLPACGDIPILVRTLHQLKHLGLGPHTLDDVHNDTFVVTWYPTAEAIVRERRIPFIPGFTALPAPGNSSLRGFAQVMDHYDHLGLLGGVIAPFERFVCLLGDVVYSWQCLEQIVDVNPVHRPVRFVGTHDLSRDGGELWGFAWHRAATHELRVNLAHALSKHPSFQAYQPGQMRRLMWEFDNMPRASWFATCDDYTRDIDLPEHVDALPQLSRAAADDDATHGVTW